MPEPFRPPPDTTRITVDKDVPVPRERNHYGRGPRSSIYPFDQMEVGDSFRVSTSQIRSTRGVRALMNSIRVAAARVLGPGNYTVRREGYDAARCWRIN